MMKKDMKSIFNGFIFGIFCGGPSSVIDQQQTKQKITLQCVIEVFFNDNLSSLVILKVTRSKRKNLLLEKYLNN